MQVLRSSYTLEETMKVMNMSAESEKRRNDSKAHMRRGRFRKDFRDMNLSHT